jgi:hypothetical protein
VTPIRASPTSTATPDRIGCSTREPTHGVGGWYLFMVYPRHPTPAVQLLDLLARQAPGSNPTLSVLPRWGQGVAGFLDFPHALPHTVWVAVVSRDSGRLAHGQELQPESTRATPFFPATVAASRNDPIFAPNSRLTHKRKYGRTPHVPREARF